MSSLTILQSALASMEVEEKKNKDESELAQKERLSLQAEVAALHAECAQLRAQVEEQRASQTLLQDEVDALRFSNETIVQMHNEQRGSYNKKLQEVYEEKQAMEDAHQADDVKWSELLQDSEKTQKQMMDGNYERDHRFCCSYLIALQRWQHRYRKCSDSKL
jgi:hypothetical protein